MGISHTTVAGAKEYTVEYTRMRNNEPHEGYRNVSPKLYEFARAVEKALRVKTIPRCEKTVHVYREGELMTLGYIGFGDFATSVHGDDKFIVCSRHVENMKYCSSGDQHNMRMAINMDTAVKHAKRNLTPYTVGECATALMKVAQSKVREVESMVKGKYREAVEEVGLNYGGYHKKCEPLMAELRAMVQAGHKFLDKELDSNVRAMFAEQEEANRFTGGAVPMDFVTITEKWGRQTVDVARLSDITSYRTDVLSTQSFQPEEVPADIQHKCAAMSICEDGQFVDGVGYRVDDRTFYVYV